MPGPLSGEPLDILRTALQSQGFPAGTIKSDGTVDAAFLLSGVFQQIEFRSNLTPSVQINVAELSADAPASPWAKLLQPTVILHGTGGSTTIAPTGVSRESVGLIVGLGLVASLVALGFMLGRSTK